MEQIRNFCTLDNKRYAVMFWDGLITLYNLYLIFRLIYYYFHGVHFLFPLLTFINFFLWLMCVAHYSYNCFTKYSEKYEWAIYIKFVYLIGFFLPDIYLYFFWPKYYYISFSGIIIIVVIILVFLISFGLEYIYLDHLKVTREQGNNGNNYTNL